LPLFFRNLFSVTSDAECIGRDERIEGKIHNSDEVEISHGIS
jgi:hypothetical protein